MNDSARRVVLLARPGAARDRMREALDLAGANIVLEADPATGDQAAVLAAQPEAALVMLADSVEASVRSLESRDEPAIRAMVSRIIDERVADGQFDECDLTFRDLERIKDAFVAQQRVDSKHADLRADS